MKVPFRQQASEYDCVPTSLLNGLSYLFDKKEIPPSVIQRIYKNSLDQLEYSGTSGRAIEEISYMLSGYAEAKYKSFRVKSDFIVGSQVHLRQKSKIIDCIKSKGVALLRVHLTLDDWHYILAFDTDDEWLYCFDPSPSSKKYLNDLDVIFVKRACNQDPNLIINYKWLEKAAEIEDFSESKISDHKYIFGPKSERRCLLLNRL